MLSYNVTLEKEEDIMGVTIPAGNCLGWTFHPNTFCLIRHSWYVQTGGLM